MLAVGSTPCELTQADYRHLAEISEDFSGSDISIAVQDALMQPIRKIQTATHYKKVSYYANLLCCCWVSMGKKITNLPPRRLSLTEQRSSHRAHLAIPVQWRCPGWTLSLTSSWSRLLYWRTSSELSAILVRQLAKRTSKRTRSGHRCLAAKDSNRSV